MFCKYQLNTTILLYILAYLNNKRRLISKHKKKISLNFDYETSTETRVSASVPIDNKTLQRKYVSCRNKIESQTTFIVGLSKCVIS